MSAESGIAVETHTEDEIRLKTLAAPGCAFHIGQLVQVRDANDASRFRLARVCDLDVRAGEKQRYVCCLVEDGWGLWPVRTWR